MNKELLMSLWQAASSHTGQETLRDSPQRGTEAHGLLFTFSLLCWKKDAVQI